MNSRAPSAVNIFTGGSVQVQIALDNPRTTWTNLDEVKGRVILQTFAPTSISSILVKLEGESRSRLKASPTSNGKYDPQPGEKPISREETHKLLYRTTDVLAGAWQGNGSLMGSRGFEIMPPGQYHYPFSFKFPFNNSCRDNNPSTASSVALFARVGAKGAAAPVAHIKRTLPPTLTTFPGVAEIRYFVKVTVKRKEFYKENPRQIINLNFLPIEPPRKPTNTAEAFALRRHQFLDVKSKGKNRLLAGFRKSSVVEASSEDGIAPHISVDVRLPSPAVLTCNESVPMRIIVKNLNGSQEPLFLQSLNIVLHGLTTVRANEIQREEASNWVILSTSNMARPLHSSQAKQAMAEGEEMVVDAELWRGRALPNNVAPSFQTCNIRRVYVLEVQVGVGFHSPHATADNTTVLPLRHAVQVYSGIAPPAALLASMSDGGQVPPPMPNRPPTTATRPEKSSSMNAPSHLRVDARPGTTATAASQSAASVSTEHLAAPQLAPLPAGEEEPPPSYEDAIADTLPPTDGPRRDYTQPEAQGGGGFGDSKSRRGS